MSPAKDAPPGARARILHAAEVIATRDGARHLTLDAAAQEAGLSKGGVLYHFPSKQALLEGMVKGAGCAMGEHIGKLRESYADGPNPTLRALIHAGQEVMTTKLGLRSALVAAIAENPALTAPIQDRFRQIWAEICAECDDETGAFLIWSAIEGFSMFLMFDIAPVDQAALSACFERLDQLARDLPGRTQPGKTPSHAQT